MLDMIVHLPIDSILPRESSQRKDYADADIESLADSIRRIDLIHPIVVDNENRLIAGGRRLAACRKLGRETVPTISRENLDPSDRRVIELEENIKRKNLSWQEEASAVLEIDNILRKEAPDWTREIRAGYVGYTEGTYNRMLVLGRALADGNERAAAAPTATAAMNIIEREDTRGVANELNTITDILLGNMPAAKEAEPEEVVVFSDEGKNDSGERKSTIAAVPRTPVPEAISQADMFEWMPKYSGPRFNLIHCDFPYGLNHGKSDQGGAKDRWKAYEDGQDMYWKLIRCLLESRDKIMLPSCHMIFWFSMKYYSETIEMFNSIAPDLDIDYQPLIWHKTDNKGIIRNVEHTARHIYETAFLITRGNRQIIKAVGDTYGAPTGKADAIHISEKPVPVLRHFYQLCVDNHTELLDPTCGGGSAIRAAHSMGAKRVMGTELDGDMAIKAQQEFRQQIAIETLRKKED